MKKKRKQTQKKRKVFDSDRNDKEDFFCKGKKIYHKAKVISEKNEELEVSFARKSVKNDKNFHLSNIPDIATVVVTDVKIILPELGLSGNTKIM